MISSIYYFAYLMAVVVLFWLMPTRVTKTALLTLASLAFVYYHNAESCYFIIGISSLTYVLGKAISRGIYPKLMHRVGVLLLFLSLFITKYLKSIWDLLGSIVSRFADGNLPSLPDILIPLGISYIVFKYISYLTDIHWKVVEPGSFIDFLCYGSLFTIFFAGPIERFERLKPQFEAAATIDNELVIKAYSRIIQGVAKKYLIVNWLFSNVIGKHIASSDAIGTIIYALAYFIYIYIDFSSYSDIAIGSSALFGIKIKENFNSPYASLNITEFWRRWHISLSEWIRDYIFFPFSSVSYKKLWQMIWVPILAMGLCGLWHGAGWKFLVWGLLHGSVIGLYQFQGKKLAKRYMGKGILYAILSNILLMAFILPSWVFFYPQFAHVHSVARIGMMSNVIVIALFCLMMLKSYLSAGVLTWKYRYLENLYMKYPILIHTVLLLITIGLGTFNTDNTFVYVDF